MLSTMRSEIQVLQQTKSDLEETVLRKTTDLDTLRKQNEDCCKILKEKIQTLETSKSELTEQLQSSKETHCTKISELEQQLGNYTDQMKALESRLEETQSSLSSSQIDYDEKFSLLKIEIGELERAKAELKAAVHNKVIEVATAREENARSEAILQATIINLQREKDAFEALVIVKDKSLAVVTTEYDGKVLELQSTLSKLHGLISDRESQLQDRDGQLHNLKTDCSILRNDLIDSKRENESLVLVIADKNRSFNDMLGVKENEIAQLHGELVSLEKAKNVEIKRVEDISNTLKLQLEKKNNNLAEIELSFKTTQSCLEREINSLKATKESLEQSLDINSANSLKTLDVHKTEVCTLKSELSELLTSKYHLEKQLSERDRSLVSLKDVHSSEIVLLKKEIDDLNLVKEQLEDSSNNNRQKFETSEKELEQSIKQLNEEIECLKAERSNLQETISNKEVQFEQKMSEQHNQVKDLQTEILLLSKSKEAIEASLMEEKRENEAFREMKELDIADAEKRLENLNAAKFVLDQTLASRTEELKELKASYSNYTQEMNVALTEAQGTIAMLTNVLGEKEMVVFALQTSQTELKTQLAGAERRNNEQSEKLLEVETRLVLLIEEYQASSAELSDQILELKSEKQKLLDDAKTKEAAINSLCEAQNERAVTVESEFNEQKSTIDALNLVNQELELKTSNLLVIKSKFESEVLNLNGHISELQRKLEQLESVLELKDNEIQTITLKFHEDVLSKQSKIETLSDKIAFLESDSTEKEKRIKGLSFSPSDLSLMDLGGQTENIPSKVVNVILSLRDKNEGLNSRLSSLQMDKVVSTENVSQKLKDLESSKEELAALLKSKDDLLLLTLDEGNKVKRNLESEISFLKSSSAELQNTLATVEIQMQKLQSERDSLYRTCSQQEQLNASKSTKISMLENELKDHKQLLDTAYDALNSINDEKNEAVDGLQSAANENDCLKESISLIREENVNLKSSWTEAKSLLVTLKTDYEALFQENKNMEITIGLLRDRVSVVQNRESEYQDVLKRVTEKEKELSELNLCHQNHVADLNNKIVSLECLCGQVDLELQSKSAIIVELKSTRRSQSEVISELTEEVRRLTTSLSQKQPSCSSVNRSSGRSQRLQSFMPSTTLTLRPSMIRRRGSPPVSSSPESQSDTSPKSQPDYSLFASPARMQRIMSPCNNKPRLHQTSKKTALFSFWNQVIFLLTIAGLAAMSLVYQSQFPRGHLNFENNHTKEFLKLDVMHPQQDQYVVEFLDKESKVDLSIYENQIEDSESYIYFFTY